MAINTKDGITATVGKHQFLSAADALYCENCFFYAGATLNVNINVCAIYRSTFGYYYYYDANLPLAVVNAGYGYYFHDSSLTSCGNAVSCVGITTEAAARAKTDCGILTSVTLPTVTSLSLVNCEIHNCSK
jgi:hypothetical protein